MPSPRTLASAFIVAGYALGAAWLLGRPFEIPPSWTIRGEPVWLGAPFVALLLPTTAWFLQWHLTDLSRSAGELPDRVRDAILLRVSAFVFGLHVMVLAGLQDLLTARAWAAQVVPVMLGLAMIGVGNLLPLTRPNAAIGLAIARLRSSRLAWMQAHRRAGYVLVTGGVVLIAAALTVPPPYGPAMILAVGPLLAVACGVLIRVARDEAGV